MRAIQESSACVCVWSVCEVSGSRRPGTGVWQWFVKRDNTAHWPAGSTVCCTYLAQPSHEDPPLFKQDTRLPQAQGGVNECVLCEMERHNGRLVALTMRFHTIRGWLGVSVTSVRWKQKLHTLQLSSVSDSHSCIRFQKAFPSALSLMSFQTWKIRCSGLSVSLLLPFL